MVTKTHKKTGLGESPAGYSLMALEKLILRDQIKQGGGRLGGLQPDDSDEGGGVVKSFGLLAGCKLGILTAVHRFSSFNTALFSMNPDFRSVNLPFINSSFGDCQMFIGIWPLIPEF